MAGLASAVWSAPALAQADSFPSKGLKIVVGPSPDHNARIMGQHLSETWGKPVVVEPRPGASGQIAAQAVASAEPDGHTLLFASPTFTLNTALKITNYDLLKDLAPVAHLGGSAYTLVVPPGLGVRSFPELVALAKSKPGELNCGSQGIGSAAHLACEMFNTIPGVRVVHVPYRNVNEAMNGVVTGQVQMYLGVAATAKVQMESNTVRGIATSGARRTQYQPELPTIAEAGYPEIVITGWNGFLATAGTPRPVLDKINGEINRGIDLPAVRARLAVSGQEYPTPLLTADGYAAFLRADIARWTRLIELVGRDKLVPNNPAR